MAVWIKEWLSLVLSCSHLCLLSLWVEQQEFPSNNRNPSPEVSHHRIPKRAKMQNNTFGGKMHVYVFKYINETGQAALKCHRCQRIDFLPVSGRKGARNYCLARGSTKLDSLCVFSQQSVSKVNLNWGGWSKHIFILIGFFFLLWMKESSNLTFGDSAAHVQTSCFHPCMKNGLVYRTSFWSLH